MHQGSWLEALWRSFGVPWPAGFSKPGTPMQHPVSPYQVLDGKWATKDRRAAAQQSHSVSEACGSRDG